MGKLARGAVFAVAPAILLAAQAVNMSGTWKLNLDKSRWGRQPKPAGEVLTIQHNEPKLSVQGTVARDREDSGAYRFNGIIGQTQTTAEGSVLVRRIDERTLESVWKSTDGRFTETSRTSISADGRELTRDVDLKRPGTEVKWTEVYDKQ